MKQTFNQLREELMNRQGSYRIEVRGENNHGPVEVPVKIVDVRRGYGRTDVLVELQAPGRGKVWTNLRNVALRQKVVDAPVSKE